MGHRYLCGSVGHESRVFVRVGRVRVTEKDTLIWDVGKWNGHIYVNEDEDEVEDELEEEDEEEVEEKVEEEKRNRKRRSFTGLDLYHRIADASGGTVYETMKSEIAAVIDIIKDSVKSRPPVSVLKFRLTSGMNSTFGIPVDVMAMNVTITLQSSLNALPTLQINRPDGSLESFTDKKKATNQTLGSKLEIIKLFAPVPGLWRVTRTSAAELLVDVTANSDLDFSYKLMTPGSSGFGLYPLTGRPIAGDNTTVQVKVPLAGNLTSVDRILLLNATGAALATSSLQQLGGRTSGRTLFKANVVIPTSEFKVAVEGVDAAGHPFRRLSPQLVATLSIDLLMLPTSGSLYVNQSISIPYLVSNVGTDTRVVVNITDDQGFAQSPTSHTHTLSAHSNATDRFVLRAGPTKGITCTVTISARAVGAPANKVQFSVRRIVVEEKVVKVVDSTSPECKVTKVIGKCDLGADVCACVNDTWYMEAEVGDNGSGLYSVFASGAGNKSTFTKSSFSPGHKIADGIVQTTLRADCCHQNAKVTVVDIAGNVDVCNVTITAGFVPPSPALCSKTKTLVSANGGSINVVNTTRISCNVTDVSGVCNLTSPGNDTSSVKCQDVDWKFTAHVGSEGFGRRQIIPVGGGRDANITRNNNTVYVNTDCCHSDVTLNIADIAGNLGQCAASVQVISPTKSTPPEDETGGGMGTSIWVIVGGVVGGVVVAAAVIVVVVVVMKKKAAAVFTLRKAKCSVVVLIAWSVIIALPQLIWFSASRPVQVEIGNNITLHGHRCLFNNDIYRDELDIYYIFDIAVITIGVTILTVLYGSIPIALRKIAASTSLEIKAGTYRLKQKQSKEPNSKAGTIAVPDVVITTTDTAEEVTTQNDTSEVATTATDTNETATTPNDIPEVATTTTDTYETATTPNDIPEVGTATPDTAEKATTPNGVEEVAAISTDAIKTSNYAESVPEIKVDKQPPKEKHQKVPIYNNTMFQLKLTLMTFTITFASLLSCLGYFYVRMLHKKQDHELSAKPGIEPMKVADDSNALNTDQPR
ncbi:uncharacterized protein LOC128235467 [Mya arenaria]|uniref:uncharacterized protein LOC128235467 n=1 Tax=Mya arenaria TaxID=6604 RepID=UPI0022E96191|nr:uncharacterized protein LOC128235467 [Mya arenaria]